MVEEEHDKSSKEEAEEVREVLEAVTGFLKQIKEPIRDLVYIVIDALNGEKLGREVAAFYRALIDNGVPEDLAKEMTREFLSKKLEAAPSIGKLMNMFTRGFSGKPKVIVASKEGGVKVLGGEEEEKK